MGVWSPEKGGRVIPSLGLRQPLPVVHPLKKGWLEPERLGLILRKNPRSPAVGHGAGATLPTVQACRHDGGEARVQALGGQGRR